MFLIDKNVVGNSIPLLFPPDNVERDVCSAGSECRIDQLDRPGMVDGAQACAVDADDYIALLKASERCRPAKGHSRDRQTAQRVRVTLRETVKT
jgi:hypothetical protein